MKAEYSPWPLADSESSTFSLMMRTAAKCEAPNENACSSCASASSAGSPVTPMTAQRTAAARPPSRITLTAPSRSTTERPKAKNATSATRLAPHSRPTVWSDKPISRQWMLAKV